jgi:GT2 family glycosyltransferase
LNSLARNNLKDVDVIVIDDGSSDNTYESVTRQFPWVLVLKGTGNLWWTGAVNLGLKTVLDKAVDSDAVLLLNNDLELPDDYLVQVRACLGRHPKSLIGSVVVSEEDREVIRSGGVTVNWLTAKTQSLNEGARLSEFGNQHIEKVSVLTGRGVAIPVEVFRKIGIYDDKHFAQCGDTELPRRAALAGYSLIVDYGMIVYNVTEDKLHINKRSCYRLRDLNKYYFDPRSNARFQYRFWFAMASHNNRFSRVMFLLADQVRVFGHFVRHMQL